MRSVFADLRPGRLRPAAASGSEHNGHKRDCPYRAQSTTKKIAPWLATICQSGGWKWKRIGKLHGGNRLRLAFRLVCVGTRTIDCVRINKKDAQLRTQSITLASSRRVSFAGLVPNGSAHIFSGILTVYPIKGQSIM